MVIKLKLGRSKTGFTLVELLIVMAIISVLAGIGIASYQNQLKKARDGRRQADLEQIRSALEMCRADTGTYPGTIYSGVACGGKTYLTTTPTDPSSHANYSYTMPGSTYTLCATLEMDGSTYCVYNP
jgi:prepilin-type N-terminal cleavage/methylation domain-containing protein